MSPENKNNGLEWNKMVHITCVWEDGNDHNASFDC